MEIEPRGFPEWMSVPSKISQRVSLIVASGEGIEYVRPVTQQGEMVVCSGMV